MGLTKFFIFFSYIKLYIFAFALLEFVNFSCYYKKQEKWLLKILSWSWGIFLLQFVITIRLLGTVKHKVQWKRGIHLYLSSLPREATCGRTAVSLACLAEAITILWAAKGNHLAGLTRSAKSLPLIIPLKLPLARLLWYHEWFCFEEKVNAKEGESCWAGKIWLHERF